MSTETVTIERLGGEGDGMAETPLGRRFVPFTAPGDLVRIRPTGKTAAELVELVAPGPARVAPPCRHFGRCGGCALQHLDPALIARWKRERVVGALAAAGVTDAEVAETISIPAGTRRRATFAAKRLRAGVTLGFAERGSHRLVDLAECPVLRLELAALIAPLRDLLATILTEGEPADLALTLTDTGIELVLIRERDLSLADREALASFAESQDLARIAWRAKLSLPSEPVTERRVPAVAFGGYNVALPPGGFLQPSVEGQRHLTRLVLEALSSTQEPIVDLFCGLGNFALPASALGSASAFDGDAESIAALQAAINANRLSTRLSATRRDLFRDPLTAEELNRYAAAIVDPPRAGARAQSSALAGSHIPIVAYVSCSPSSFARDAAILIAGGYRLERVTPVDQFLWSPHVELVGVFRRE